MKTLSLLAALSFASLAAAQDTLLAGATVHTVTGETLSPGQVLLRDGRIAAVGASLDAPGASVVDLTGLHLYPGLICPTSSLGLTEISAVRATQDTNEVGTWTPELRAEIAVNPDSELIGVARANGITHVLTLPQGGTIAGHSALLALEGWTWEEMTVASPVALHLSWPGMGLDATPKEEWKRKDEWKPLEKQAEERRARLKELDDFFAEARAWLKARDEGKVEASPAWEAMRPCLEGKVPLFIHASELRQIEAGLAWAAEQGLKRVVIAGGRDAWMAGEALAKAGVPVIYEETFALTPRDWDAYDTQFAAPEKLRRAGVKFAFSTGPGSWGAANVRNLPYHAAQASAFGLPRDEALKAITIRAAEILGVEKRFGSIETGKEASLFAADGDILDIRTNVKRMWIGGKEVKLESRHTRLYEKYKARPR